MVEAAEEKGGNSSDKTAKTLNKCLVKRTACDGTHFADRFELFRLFRQRGLHRPFGPFPSVQGGVGLSQQRRQ